MDDLEHLEPKDEPPAEPQSETEPGPARRTIERIRSGVAAARDPIADRVGHAMEDAGRSWSERPGARIRRVRRMASQPLPYLYDVHPEARFGRPVEVGLQTIDIDDIAGSAVGGGQRGGDYLPLRPSRTANWQSRWQRLKLAQDGLVVLPPIDIVKYAGTYWVVDGHNRVAMALYIGQVAVDADVVELVPMGGRRTEPIASLATSAAASRAVRTAGSGKSPSNALSREDAVEVDGPDDGG